MIDLSHVGFSYAGSQAGVRDVCLHVRRGECVVLVGASGSGKTTIARLVNGLVPSFYEGRRTGTMRLAGKNVDDEPLWARGKTVGSVFQDPKSQFFSAEMAGEVAFACENYGLSHGEITKRTDDAIRRLGLEALRDRRLDVLSSGEKQRVAVASVYALDPPIYVCDEPTANLDEAGVEKLRRTLKLLKDEGRTLLVVEHRLAWLMGIADRFCYMRDGRIEREWAPEELARLSQGELDELGLRAPLEAKGQNADGRRLFADSALRAVDDSARPFVAAEGLSCRFGENVVWEGLDFEAWRGQVVAVTGRNGAGKTTLARVIAGLLRADKGRVLIDGAPLRPQARRRRCWYGSNDAGTQFFADSVAEELMLNLDRMQETSAMARELLGRFGLSGLEGEHPAVLSGGQKQRLSIACGLLSGRDVLIFDEPTSGLDGGNMRAIASAISEAVAGGKAAIVVTHDEELIGRCCDARFTVP